MSKIFYRRKTEMETDFWALNWPSINSPNRFSEISQLEQAILIASKFATKASMCAYMCMATEIATKIATRYATRVFMCIHVCKATEIATKIATRYATRVTM